MMITTKVVSNVSFFYGPSRISFSLVSSPEDGSRQVRDLSGCRDYINDCVIQHHYRNTDYFKKGDDYLYRWRSIPVDTKNLRLLISKGEEDRNDEFEEKLKMALKVINIYESFAKWKVKSYLNKVDFTNNKFKGCWMLVGPEEWMKSTHLISMVTLITRVVCNNPIFGKCESVKAVEKCFDSLCKTAVADSWTDLGDYLPKSWPKFRMIMKDYDYLFRRFKFEDLNPENKCFDWHDVGGITCLCTFATGVAKLDARMKKMWENKYAPLGGLSDRLARRVVVSSRLRKTALKKE